MHVLIGLDILKQAYSAMLLLTKRIQYDFFFFFLNRTVWQRSSDPFDILTYYIKWVTLLLGQAVMNLNLMFTSLRTKGTFIWN